MAYRSGTSVRDHALRELGGRSVGGRPCSCRTRAYQPNRRHDRQGAHHEKLRSPGAHRVDHTACRWCRDRRYEEAEDSLTAVTVGDGRVIHNAMSSLPDSSAAYSSLIRIVAQVRILPGGSCIALVPTRNTVRIASIEVAGVLR